MTSQTEQKAILNRGLTEYWPSPSVVQQLDLHKLLFGRPDAPGSTLVPLLAKYGPKPEKLFVSGDTITWTDTRGAGPLGPAMELRLLLLSFQQLEGQAPDLDIPHAAQQLVPCLASHVLTHLTGAALEQSEALLQDPQANVYGRMVFPMGPALLHLQVQQAISTKEVHMLRQFVQTQTSDASNSQQQKDELDEIKPMTPKFAISKIKNQLNGAKLAFTCLSRMSSMHQLMTVG